jgi:hypothetical protein
MHPAAAATPMTLAHNADNGDFFIAPRESKRWATRQA